ncbi:hypothetical protein PtB15_4B303 [Puccinia triticina]|nr:hypothetical protein PtB15_4B303 [Puccinia triticina]
MSIPKSGSQSERAAFTGLNCSLFWGVSGQRLGPPLCSLVAVSIPNSPDEATSERPESSEDAQRGSKPYIAPSCGSQPSAGRMCRVGGDEKYVL